MGGSSSPPESTMFFDGKRRGLSAINGNIDPKYGPSDKPRAGPASPVTRMVGNREATRNATTAKGVIPQRVQEYDRTSGAKTTRKFYR